MSHFSLEGKKTGLFLGPCWTYLCGTVGLYICGRFFSFSVSQDDGSWGKDLCINYIGMKKMEIFLHDSCFGRHSRVVSAHPRDFRFFLLLDWFRSFAASFFAPSTSLSLAVLYFLPETDVFHIPPVSGLSPSSSLQIIRSLVLILCTKPLNMAGEWQLDGGK